MRRELPNRPHIDHLKAQAKDLLDGHRSRLPEALMRIKSALPALANATLDEIAAAPFALHDAQSVIAREYGFPSFTKLREHVLAARRQSLPAELVARLLGKPLPEDVDAALRNAFAARAEGALDALPTPEEVPVVAVRNAVISPGAVAPLSIGRPASLSALEYAAAGSGLVALFAQRDEAVEEPGAEDLHGTGCLAVVRSLRRADSGEAWVVLEGVRWIKFVSLVATEPFPCARVAPAPLDEGDPDELEALETELREAARRSAGTMPQGDAVIAIIDAIDGPERLCDLIVANLPCTVEEKVAYAAEPVLTRRLELALGWLERAR